jgi:hypothetical protein
MVQTEKNEIVEKAEVAANQIHAYIVLRSAWIKTDDSDAAILLYSLRTQLIDEMSCETLFTAQNLYNFTHVI